MSALRPKGRGEVKQSLRAVKTKHTLTIESYVKEADIKKGVADYLQIKMNQGKLWFARLNSGEIIAVAGESRRRIKLCPPGTADFIVIAPELILNFMPKVIFLECKMLKGGEQSPEQKEFEALVKKMCCHYFIVRDTSEVMRMFGD